MDVNEKSVILIIPLSSESTSSPEFLGSCSWDLLSSGSHSSIRRGHLQLDWCRPELGCKQVGLSSLSGVLRKTCPEHNCAALDQP